MSNRNIVKNSAKTFREGFPRQFSIIVDVSDEGKDILVKKENELKAVNVLFKKVNNQKEKENVFKDKEIEELNDRIQQLRVKNYDLDMAIANELKIKTQMQLEQNRIAHYCNDIKKKFDNSEKTIENYENTIAKMQNENEQLAQKYDIDLDDLERVNKKLISQIDEKINLFNKQKTMLLGSETKLSDIQGEIDQQRKTFEDRAAINKIKYDELEKKYSNLQKKIYNLQMNAELRRKDKMSQAKKMKGDFNEKEELEKQIEEFNKKNQELTEQINNVNKEWKHISTRSTNSLYSSATLNTMRSNNTSRRSRMSKHI